MTENGHTDCQQLFNLIIIIITVFSIDNAPQAIKQDNIVEIYENL